MRSSAAVLRGEDFSAFRSSGGQDLTSALRAHSGAETVHLRSVPFVRLKCHFHDVFTPFLVVCNVLSARVFRARVPLFPGKRAQKPLFPHIRLNIILNGFPSVKRKFSNLFST